jgi:hypothetical protein
MPNYGIAPSSTGFGPFLALRDQHVGDGHLRGFEQPQMIFSL